MIIFLYGPDGYRLKENVDTIVGAYRKKYTNGMSYYRFDLSGESKFDDLVDAVKSTSFFDEAKLIVVKNSFSYDGQTIINWVGGLIQDFKISEDKKTVLVFAENKSESELRKANKDLFALLIGKKPLVRNFEYLSGAKLSNWVRSKFKENRHNVSPAVINSLISAVGNESWALANEVEKLCNYKTYSEHSDIVSTKSDKLVDSDYAQITEKDVELLVDWKEISNIFELTDAVGNQNKAKAFERMFRLTNSGQDPHYLLSMIVYHFENLLSVYDGSIPKHLHPFVAKKAASQARRFSKEELLSKFNYLAELDVASKSGQVNLEDALYNFLFT